MERDGRRGWGVFIGGRTLGLGPVWSIALEFSRPLWTRHETMRHQFRYALLTYAQCGDLDPFKIVDRLAELHAECIIGREYHEDGGTHLHAFVDFGRKYRSRDTRAFDVEGYHPNISPSKGRPGDGFDYATKDGDIVAGGLERPSNTSARSRGSLEEAATSIMAAKDKKELYELCSELAPSKMLWSYPSLRAYANDRFVEERPAYRHPEGVTVNTSAYPELDRWVTENLDGFRMGRRGRSLILIGPSRLGKTVWARSLRANHVHFGNMFNLDEFREDCDYVIFDDMQGGLEYFPGYKGWLGHQSHFTATDKYRGKRAVNWGKPAIWCSNSDPRADKGADADWLDANCEFVFINESIVTVE